ncbi:hypothetical protein E8E14_006529 [Neopestalotiopsis sp. 37M]|nr:hypothetical protein E8E14_006529 [Neopestalotiopsis sp. 37M]
MPDGRERTVRFRESDSSSRTSPRSRDSGLAQDYDTQRFNVGALQEALDSCREEKGRYKSKATDLDAQLSATKSSLREKELENRTLREENTTLRRERDSFESEVHDLRRRLAPSSESDYMMSGGSGESSNGLNRTRSKRHESQEQKSRLLERINTVNPNEPNRDSTRRRRSSVSQPRTPFTREVLVDDRTLRGPPLTTRGFDRFENNYTTSPTIRAEAGSVSSPRSATSSMNTFNTAISGDYVPEPLPPKPKVESKSSSSRKHRHH